MGRNGVAVVRLRGESNVNSRRPLIPNVMPRLPPNLAEHMAEYFSQDAHHWPGARANGRPRTMSLSFADATAWYVAPLAEAWNSLLGASYTAACGLPLALAKSDEPTDAFLRCREQRHPETNDRGLAYELRFPSTSDVWSGWFLLEE
jgi:hypothetical protein